MEKYVSKLNNNVIINCGHTVVKGTYENLSFGISTSVSQSELQTVIDGIAFALLLKEQGKSVSFSITLSDSYLFEGKNQGRRELKAAVEKGLSFSIIPPEYVRIFTQAGFNDSNVNVILQTDANRAFEKVIRGLRKTVNKVRQELDANAFLDWSFTHYNCLFLTDSKRQLFSLTHPFLFNTEKERDFFEGNHWRNTDVNNGWLKHLPLLRLKKNPVINLYQNGGKLLCPGTYAGVLKLLNKDCDIVEFISRKDDQFIGEKIYRGVIASHILERNTQNCLLIIKSEDDESEVTLFSDEVFKTDRVTAHELYDMFIKTHTGEMILL